MVKASGSSRVRVRRRFFFLLGNLPCGSLIYVVYLIVKLWVGILLLLSYGPIILKSIV